MKLCSACAKQNTSVNASYACSILAKQALFDLVGQSPSSLIINLEQVMKSFLVSNIYFLFLLPVVDSAFLLSTEEQLHVNIVRTSFLCYVAGF